MKLFMDIMRLGHCLPNYKFSTTYNTNVVTTQTSELGKQTVRLA